MGREYFSQKGSNCYLIDLDNDEGYSFSEFGKSIEKVNAKYVVSICKLLKPVDIFSILSDSMGTDCEIYFKGKKAVVNKKGFDVYKMVASTFKRETFITFRITRNECLGLTQILIPFKKDEVSFKMIEEILGILTWE